MFHQGRESLGGNIAGQRLGRFAPGRPDPVSSKAKKCTCRQPHERLRRRSRKSWSILTGSSESASQRQTRTRRAPGRMPEHTRDRRDRKELSRLRVRGTCGRSGLRQQLGITSPLEPIVTGRPERLRNVVSGSRPSWW